MCALGRAKDEVGRIKNKERQSLRGRCQGKLTIVGIGPGDSDSLTPRAYRAIQACQVIVGYAAYLQLLNGLPPDKEIISSGMRQELKRAEKAIERALDGKNVCLISSGDPGIYGMAGVILELLGKEAGKIPIEIIPGVTAASSSAGLLGAPLMNDFTVISLSDLLTDIRIIEKRVRSACSGDFVIVFYNPRSRKRIRPLEKAWQILMKYRSPQTPVGIVRNARRTDEQVTVTSLKEMLSVRRIDMGTTIIVGNSKTFVKGGYMITPRGYEQKIRPNKHDPQS